MATTTTLISASRDIPMSTANEDVPTHGTLRYITRGIIPTASPHLYHLPPLAEFGDVRSVRMTNIKDSLQLDGQSPYSLDSHGFTARHHASMLHSAPYSRPSWNDEKLLKSIYIPEVEDLLKKLTGATNVVTEMALIRSEVHSEVDALASSEDQPKAIQNEDEDPWPKMIGLSAGAGASPAPKVHLDFSPSGARVHLRKFHGDLAKAGAGVISSEDRDIANGVKHNDLHKSYEGPRWAMYSIWRPLKRVTRDPLAFADRRTFPKEDYVPVDLVEPTGKSLRNLYPTEAESHKAETLLAYGSEDHEWCWIWNMEPEEVVAIQLFDSEAEKMGYGGVMHSSVDVKGTESEPARESIEVRCTAFW